MTADKEQGIHSLNQDYARYDQVDKSHVYRLAENEDDLFDDEYRIQTCDIGSFLDGDQVQEVIVPIARFRPLP